MLELARAQAADGDRDGARVTLRDASARIADARDAGALPDLLAGLEAKVGPAAGGGPGADELSDRELEVLRALTGTGSLREIADSLFISHNTIKTHVRTLYFKLGVRSREQAVAKGKELGVI
jgi:LuxR family transcriptional regulator, maltose regulon positive regulatory protein